MTISPLNQARWARFRANSRGFWALWVFLLLFILSLLSNRSEEHTSELQSHRDLHSFPTRRSSDLIPPEPGPLGTFSRQLTRLLGAVGFPAADHPVAVIQCGRQRKAAAGELSGPYLCAIHVQLQRSHLWGRTGNPGGLSGPFRCGADNGARLGGVGPHPTQL